MNSARKFDFPGGITVTDYGNSISCNCGHDTIKFGACLHVLVYIGKRNPRGAGERRFKDRRKGDRRGQK
jgi:hypothetical protein